MAVRSWSCSLRKTWGASWVAPIEGPPIRDGEVTIEDGRVFSVGPAIAPDVFHDGCVITPGLVNAHTHLEYGSSFADLATSGLPFPQWIRELTRRRHELPLDQYVDEALDGARRSVAAGVTCVADIVTHGGGLQGAAGLAGISYVEAVAADDARWASSERERVLQLLDSAPIGRSVGLSPHTLYTLGSAVFTAIVELARERGLRIHTHLAETVQEAEFVLAGTGPIADSFRGVFDFELLASGGSGLTPAGQLAAIGGIGPDVHVAHGVHLSGPDRSLLTSAGTRVALCPRSNHILGAGVAPFVDLLADGACVGTDSLASSPSLSVLEELRELRPYAPADVLLAAGTIAGARAMGLRDVGLLAEGARGDIAVWNVGGAVDDPFEAMLNSAECIETVLFGMPVFARDEVAV